MVYRSHAGGFGRLSRRGNRAKGKEKVAHLKGWFTKKKKKKMGKLFLRVNGRLRFKYLLA